ncbi:5-methylthioadenosine/S-adenosylhomocysteine deaminase n1 [Mytilinidion resinicola]|uniref:5-methylthioadenosine/S-adenosylhomocysteine deaminase n1 n=1 Tax=Mytilinidion resinicola TaxID=574789 RepID=A0A6A6YYK9_9PEZI|nr:5-methylthioadenosine/S-adenosylhomocysteine deaminase n1 [Mytilinidion resinicola]KAF2813037.1 5-methylthioadenosine/S-adenosylhomocysteine deaminase n1 [Mytilinidion resinicola]
MPSSILLKNGTALLHDGNDHVRSEKTDILITGNKIAKIAPNINVATLQDVDTIDCTDKIISPGFVDTHHHLWQTQLKGRHADELLLDYMVTGNAQSSQYTDPSIFYGQLAGCLEALAAGTTYILDHAHIDYSPTASKTALAATISSGIRSTFAYTPISRVVSWTPLTTSPTPLEPWVFPNLTNLSAALAAGWGAARVQLGLGFDLFFLGPALVTKLFSHAKALGVTTITSHYVRSAQMSLASLPETMRAFGVLDEHIVLSHATGCSLSDVELITAAGAHVSSTPATELQMSLGTPVAWREDIPGIHDSCSLGVDCHSAVSGSIVEAMRLGLQAARGQRNQRFEARGVTPTGLHEAMRVERAFNLGTIMGARAVRMEGRIGSLAEGKLADVVVFDALSPAMVGAGQQDAVVAVVMHSSPADVEMVIVDGVVRKRDGKLVDVVVDEVARDVVGREKLGWGDVAKEIVRSREEIQGKIEKIDFVDSKERLVKSFHVDQSKVVDDV